jgi:hypothetical protein
VTRAALPRTLWYEHQGVVVEVDQRFLTVDPQPLVVLGEAGMGKSTLLASLDQAPGFALCTARQLINRPDPASILGRATTIVIDALDEVSAQREGDAVDLVLQKLGKLGYPRFILSCRVADWRSATALQGIGEHYTAQPLELHLNPLSRSDAVAFLAQTIGLERSEAALFHLEDRGLEGLWRNPQSLALVEIVAAAGNLPDSKGDLFAAAVRLLRTEHREEKGHTPLASLPEQDVLNASGAAFASLILSGRDALTRRVQPAGDDLPLSEVSTLPGAGRIAAIVGARLFEARGPERFTYAHRAIGEFLGARWLAAQATTPQKQRRLGALLQSQSLVPASLRGIHAWLAWHSSSLALAAIEADPMGIIEYGDADNLSVEQGRALLQALGRLSQENPRFREWGPYRVGGIIQTALLPEIRDLLTAPDTEFGLRLLVLQALKGSTIAEEVADALRTLLLDRDAIFANRSEAGDRLAELKLIEDWPRIVAELLAQGNENGIRLGIEMIDEVGYEHFDDNLIVEAIFAQLARAESHVGVFYGLQRRMAAERLEGLIDKLSARMAAMAKPEEREGSGQLSDLMYGLIARHVRENVVRADQLWNWLKPLDSHSGYGKSREDIAQLLKDDDGLRQAVQHHVLLELGGDKTVWERAWRLSDRSIGFAANEADVLELLSSLNPEARQDERWRDVVQLTPHSATEGIEVRELARRFAAHRPDLLEWIDKLAEPRVYDWQIKQEERARKLRAERAAQWAEHRKDFSKHAAEIKRGDFEYLVNPAQAYLKLFSDMGDEAPDGPSRLVEWLGPDLADACLAGFEAFLKQSSPKPTARDISESHAYSRRWSASNIIVVALAERLRRGVGFADLPEERLMAGLFELFHSRVDDHAGIIGLEEALSAELNSRGAWEGAMRLYCEPQFARQRTHVDRLYVLMREDNEELATKLAAKWLVEYPDLPGEPESELIDRLLRSGRRDLLHSIQQVRLAQAIPEDEKRRNWQAVSLIVDFPRAQHQPYAAGTVEPELLWHLRARLGDRRRDNRQGSLNGAQLSWIIRTFRPLFPRRLRPTTVTRGDTNPWDATEYLNTLIGRLGNETSDDDLASLAQLRDADPDGYTEHLRVVAAEQRRNRIEAEFHRPSLCDIKAVVAHEPPTDATLLQQLISEELSMVQAKVLGSDVDWYKDFTSDAGEPRIEDDCRDAILKMLRPLPFDIQALPEGHIADDKRCDIICLLGDLMVPIEVKGQWHPKLWTAADKQLDRLYVNDWRAERGIYLVLWFGLGTAKPLRPPPAGIVPPTTADELRLALRALSTTAQASRLEVFVLDLTRPSA